MANIVNIKTKIKAHLEALRVAGTILSWQALNYQQEILNLNISKFPAAVLLPCTESGVEETNRDNLRTYTYDIVILQKGENVRTDTDIETLCEAILDRFDNDPTLGGAANGGVPPTSSETVVIGSGDQTYVVFSVTVKARALVTLA